MMYVMCYFQVLSKPKVIIEDQNKPQTQQQQVSFMFLELIQILFSSLCVFAFSHCLPLLLFVVCLHSNKTYKKYIWLCKKLSQTTRFAKISSVSLHQIAQLTQSSTSTNDTSTSTRDTLENFEQQQEDMVNKVGGSVLNSVC
jgi:hypothetical protein